MNSQIISRELLSRLKTIVGTNGYIDNPSDMDAYLEDRRGYTKGLSPLILKPKNTEEVSRIVHLCNEAHVGIVPQGGNTGLVGGSVPDDTGSELVLSLERLNNIRDIDATNYTMTVEAGCILANIQNAAQEVNRLYPLSLAAEGSCQIGGNLATNAGGTAVLQYGNTRELVLGVEVVLPSGEIWNGLRRLRKDNTGYDLKHLFIGSEGTLGVITAAVLKLFPQPIERATALVAMPSLEVSTTLLEILREQSGDQITAFEYMDSACMNLLVEHTELSNPFDEDYQHYALVELSSSSPDANLSSLLEETLEMAFEKEIVVNAVIASSVSQAKMLWNLRETLPDTYKKAGAFIALDISVPVSQVPKFVKQAKQYCKEAIKSSRILAFGHIGDGNIHFILAQEKDSDASKFITYKPQLSAGIYDISQSLNGSFSAEHGVGRVKKGTLTHYKSSTELGLMLALKQSIDPNGIMNPGKVLQQ